MLIKVIYVCQCYWCDNRCSSGIDRNRQEWHKNDCEKHKLKDENMCTKGVTTVPPSIVNNTVVESSTKSESRNIYFYCKI